MASRSEPEDDYFVCPHCGADVACGSVVCHQCGASDDSGWNAGDGGSDDEQDDDFDYDDFVQREFPGHARANGIGTPKAWLTAIIVLLLCLALLMVW